MFKMGFKNQSLKTPTAESICNLAKQFIKPTTQWTTIMMRCKWTCEKGCHKWTMLAQVRVNNVRVNNVVTGSSEHPPANDSLRGLPGGSPTRPLWLLWGGEQMVFKLNLKFIQLLSMMIICTSDNNILKIHFFNYFQRRDSGAVARKAPLLWVTRFPSVSLSSPLLLMSS